MGARPLYKEDGISGGLRQLMAECRAHGIRIKLVMLDREFFTVKCIRVLDELCLGYLTPCSNRPGAVTAIRQFADGKRQDVSENKLSGSDGAVSYTLVITERRRRKKNPKKDPSPEEKYIGFAINVPDIDVEVYVHRWVVETGYSKAEAMRPRSRNNGARLLLSVRAGHIQRVGNVERAVAYRIGGAPQAQTDDPRRDEDRHSGVSVGTKTSFASAAGRTDRRMTVCRYLIWAPGPERAPILGARRLRQSGRPEFDRRFGQTRGNPTFVRISV